MRLRSALRELLPRPLVAAYDAQRTARLHKRNANSSAEEVFTRIYARNEWGGEPGTFCSGDGSALPQLIDPYVCGILSELERRGARGLRAIDLGCGDFSIGRRIAEACGSYVGVDIVRALIERNRKEFGGPTVAFEHRNIVEDGLPSGDICFVRQVFQHLSNAQILSVLPKLKRYRWSFITEHHPSRLRVANIDKPHGGDIRVAHESGVFLEEPPFSLPRDRYQLLFSVDGLELPGGRDPGIIRTYLYTPAQ